MLQSLATIQTTTPITVMLPMGKTKVATLAIQLDMLIDDLFIFIYIILQYITTCESFNIGYDFCISYGITLDLA